MEKRLSQYHILLTLCFTLMSSVITGCAMSETDSASDGAAEATEELPALDAGTDAVPVANAETPAAVDDLDAPAPDQAAATTAENPPADLGGDPLDQPPAADPTLAAASPSPSPMADPVLAEAVTPSPTPSAVEPAIEPAIPVVAESNQTHSSESGPAESYSVQTGDTLMKIAFEHYGDLYQWRKIYDDNRDKINNPNSIPRGTVLTLRDVPSVQIEKNGEKYLIRSGDTLGTISDDIYGTTKKWRKLWENNKQLIKDPNRIFAGFHLYYTMTPDEKREAEQLKENPSEPAVAPAPMAQDERPSMREPASVAAPAVAPMVAPQNPIAPGSLSPPPASVSSVPAAPSGG